MTPARDAQRTVFAVGDRKQSIYSFQGADVDAFDRSRRLLRDRVEAAGGAWQDAQLDVSFRSTAPVLDLVDRVFADPRAARRRCRTGPDAAPPRRSGGARGERRAVAADAGAGCLAEPEPWTVAEQNHGLTSAPQRLAETLAQWIAREAGGGTMLESKGRPLGPGDVMVLVRRRNEFGRALVRALKALRRAGGGPGPPGADRPAGGAGSDGARRCAAAAAGRSHASPAC